MPTQQNQDTEKLMKEYELTLNLAMHDDTLLQERNGNFLTVNTILFAASAALITTKGILSNVSSALVILSLLGLGVCVMWYLLQVRHAEVLRLKRYQLRSIEGELGFSLYTNMNKALYRHDPISFAGLVNESFNISPQAKFSASQVERTLPVALGVAWLAMLMYSFIL